MQQGQHSSLLCMQTPLHLMKISHLSEQVWASLTCREVLRGSAWPQPSTPTPLDHRGEEQPLPKETKSGERRAGVTELRQQAQPELQLLLAQLLLHTACRMPEAVHGPAGKSLPQPAQAAGLMDSRCQAAAQREEELGGMQGLGITAQQGCTPGCQRASYGTLQNSGSVKGGE